MAEAKIALRDVAYISELVIFIPFGAVLMGKTNTQEWGCGPAGDQSYFGPVHNPWDIARISGGSSSGSAAAVASGMVPCALGSDAGGSIRIPAALCGIDRK